MKFRAFSVCGGILLRNYKTNSAHEILPRISPVKFHKRNSKMKFYGRNSIAKISQQSPEILSRGKIPRLKILRKYEIFYLIADRLFGLCSVDLQGLNAARRACLRHKILHAH